MILRNDLLAFNFYKKEKFTGSYLGMRYRIEKAVRDENDVFLVTTWPGPYNYASTDEKLRAEKTFPFEENALNDITNYLNETYESTKDTLRARL